MNVLLIHIRFPEFDRCSGDLRLTNLLRILVRRHKVALHILYKPATYLTAPENRDYLALMQELGIEVTTGSLRTTLRKCGYAAVMIEFWYVARHLVNEIRTLQPNARVVVDTEHVYFYSSQFKAKVLDLDSRSPELLGEKRDELETYAKSDLVITTTEEDKRVLLGENSKLTISTIPNIHEIPDAGAPAKGSRAPNSIIFVGNFANNPSNVDAMIYFCAEILPLIRRCIPHAVLTIVGNMPPDEVRALVSDHVTVTGYVPATAPYLAAAMVSVCPLRFGAGLKGKIGEAMMHGVPVVTTSIGTQGMEARHNQDIMVGDAPGTFAECVIRVLEEPMLWDTLSRNGRQLIINNYSSEAVVAKVNKIMGDITDLPVKRYGTIKRLALRAVLDLGDSLARNLLWRFQKPNRK